jgi:hypothetical protein
VAITRPLNTLRVPAAIPHDYDLPDEDTLAWPCAGEFRPGQGSVTPLDVSERSQGLSKPESPELKALLNVERRPGIDLGTHQLQTWCSMPSTWTAMTFMAGAFNPDGRYAAVGTLRRISSEGLGHVEEGRAGPD